MSVEIIINPQFNLPNLKFSEKPSKDMLDEMKAHGWRWSKTNNLWYPGNKEAKANAENFAKYFVDKFFPHIVEDINNAIEEYVNELQNNEEIEKLNDNEKKVFGLLKSTTNMS